MRCGIHMVWCERREGGEEEISPLALVVKEVFPRLMLVILDWEILTHGWLIVI